MLAQLTPLVTEAARYVLGLSIAACFIALVAALALRQVGGSHDHPDATTRGLLMVVIALTAATFVLLLALIYAL